MGRSLRLAIFSVALVGVASLTWATLFYLPTGGNAALGGGRTGVWLGVAFWMGLALLASALPVRTSGGTFVDVSIAAVLAAMNLGGPAVAGWVALLGTTQLRELRGDVPWYGVVANHSMVVAAAVLSSLLFLAVPPHGDLGLDLTVTVLAGSCFFTLNLVSAAAFLSLRTGDPIVRFVRADGGAYLNMLALAPLAWLMAKMYVQAGWWAVLLFAVPLHTTRLAYRRFVEVREMFTQTVSSLAEAVDKRDKFTSGHSHRVQEIAVEIGRVMGLTDTELEVLEWGGLLHDIGKIGVPDAVLLKQERLSRDERAIMNSHPVLGAEIIAPVEKLAPELPIIRHHHEWFNGSGYPDRLVGDGIPRLARILHVADAFEAMTAIRPYRMTPLTAEQALGELRKFGGIQFDPDVVDAFVRTERALDIPDPGRPEPREVPMLGQAAEAIAAVTLASGEVGMTARGIHGPQTAQG